MDWKQDRLKSYVVYGIVDPDISKYVYIGSTKQRLMDRKNGHSANHGNPLFEKWLNDRKNKGEKILFQVIHECEIKGQFNRDLEYWEFFYIKKFKNEGHPLFNVQIRDVPYPKLPDVATILKSGKYNNSWVAKLLYPSIGERSAIAKLHNKLNNIGGRRLSDEEIKKIEIILK